MKGATRKEMIENLRKDISDFKKNNNCARIVVIWAASTEIYVPYYSPVHDSLADLEKAIEANDKEHIAPSMCYAYAALKEDAPFIMGAPNTTVDIPAVWELAEQTKVPIAGKDFNETQVGVNKNVLLNVDLNVNYHNFKPDEGSRENGVGVGVSVKF